MKMFDIVALFPLFLFGLMLCIVLTIGCINPCKDGKCKPCPDGKCPPCKPHCDKDSCKPCCPH